MTRAKETKTPRPGTAGRPSAVRLGLRPGLAVNQLLAAAVEKSVRAGAGLISSKHFLWPDFRMMPALVHPEGKALLPLPGRVRAPRRG